MKKYPVHEHGRYTVISLTGEVDLNFSPQAREQILKQLKKKKPVLVDLSAVEYIDSSGVASLVEGFQTAKRTNLDYGLLGISDAVQQVLSITRLDGIFPLYESEENFFQSFSR